MILQYAKKYRLEFLNRFAQILLLYNNISILDRPEASSQCNSKEFSSSQCGNLGLNIKALQLLHPAHSCQPPHENRWRSDESYEAELGESSAAKIIVIRALRMELCSREALRQPNSKDLRRAEVHGTVPLRQARLTCLCNCLHLRTIPSHHMKIDDVVTKLMELS